MVYDGLLVFALLLVATFPFVGLTGGAVTPLSRALLQLYVIVVCGAYFTWFWTHGGQTLSMKTWHIRLMADNGDALRLPRALLRYSAALAGIGCLGVGLVWALFDPQRRFLHDRIAGTRLVLLKSAPGKAGAATVAADAKEG